MENVESHLSWRQVYRLGALAAIGAVLVGLLEIAITFLPGGNTAQETVVDWFRLFQENQFMGLRNLGLLNIALNTLAILIYFALYALHRQTPARPWAMLAMLIAFLGIGTFYATNRAFPMLALSKQYALAGSDAQRAALEAAAQAMLSVGQSHTPGTFLGFFLNEAAGMMMAIVILRGNLLNRATAYVGLLGWGCLLLFEVLSSFVSGLNMITMLFAMFGGILTMGWYILVAKKLFRQGQNILVVSKANLAGVE